METRSNTLYIMQSWLRKTLLLRLDNHLTIWNVSFSKEKKIKEKEHIAHTLGTLQK